MNEATKISLSQGFVPAGTRLSGIYEIESPLAKGGMGEIYRGRAIETGDPVAIKLIRADMADSEAALALFRREASALNRLHHEAIVRYFVFSLDPVLQRHYLAMELVEGVSLSVLAGRGPLGVVDAHALLVRIASGLNAAHERGIVHRDVSPDNIIVEDGNVAHARIIDFGIARSTRVGDATVIGSGFAGKYNYVSPEQLGLFGGDVTGKSDIYSLALVIAQCLRGKPIDMGGSQVDIIEKRRTVPDLSDIDARLRPLLTRMLQPNPMDRFASMAEVAAAPLPEVSHYGKRQKPAAAVTDKRAVSTPKEGRDSLKWAFASIAGLALLGAAGFVGFLYFEPSDEVVKIAAAGPQLSSPVRERPADVPQLQVEPTAPPAPDIPAPPPVVPQVVAVVPPIQPPTAPTPPQPPQLSATQRVARYVSGYDGGACFLALPTAVTANSAEIDAFALDSRPFEMLDEAFKLANGFEATIDGGQVTKGQCAALTFVRQLLTKPGSRPGKLSIAKSVLVGGEALSGVVTSSLPYVQLLIIDDEGAILDATERLAGSGGQRNFTLQLAKSGRSGTQPALVMAIGSDRPSPGLSASSAASPTRLNAAIGELEAKGSSFEVALKYLKMR